MITQTVYVGQPARLSTALSQLKITTERGEHSMPIEDIGLLELDSPQISVTIPLLNALALQNVAVVTCGVNHHPVGLYLPLSAHSTHTQRLRPQIEASVPTKKRLWQSIVRHKIRNQGDMLRAVGYDPTPFHRLIANVKTGDSTNREAVSANRYWKYVFKDFPCVEPTFTREPEGDFPNNLLNYTYAILRAMVARGIVATGLHPSIGLFHKNKYNAFCLADDMMEPYRAFADLVVAYTIRSWKAPKFNLTPQIKQQLLLLLAIDTDGGEQGTVPLMNAVQRTCSSLWGVLAGEQQSLFYPRLCPIDLRNVDSELSVKNMN
ncbi:MAG: type II CRISPR-associated endonuclease Cas1 [Candidatus Kapaibacterium sp.]